METQKSLRSSRSATIALNPQKQTISDISNLIAKIGGLAGCEMCGRIALLNIDFVSDPPGELAQLGAISLETRGL